LRRIIKILPILLIITLVSCNRGFKDSFSTKRPNKGRTITTHNKAGKGGGEKNIFKATKKFFTDIFSVKDKKGKRTKDSFGSKRNRKSGGSKFDKNKKRVVSNGGKDKNSKESFGSRRKENQSSNRFSPKKHKVISSNEKGGESGGSFGKRVKRDKSNLKFNKKKGRVVEKGGFFNIFKSKTGSKDGFKTKVRKHTGNFKFSKSKGKVVNKKRILWFVASGPRHHDSFGTKRKGNKSGFSFSSKKKKVIRKKVAFSGFGKRDGSRDSFGKKRKSSGSGFRYNSKKKRVLLSGSQGKDISAGTFGGKRRTHSTYKKNVFNKKHKRVVQRNSWWHDTIDKIFHKKKKNKPEMELFEPGIRRKYKFGRSNRL